MQHINVPGPSSQTVVATAPAVIDSAVATYDCGAAISNVESRPVIVSRLPAADSAKLLEDTPQAAGSRHREMTQKQKAQLQFCIDTSHVRQLRALLAGGIAPEILNAQDKLGIPLLNKVIYAGSRKIIDMLLDTPGIDVASKSKFGRTPLMAAALIGDMVTLERLLAILTIADVNATEQDGRTALYIACQVHHLVMVKRLLKIPGIKLNAVKHEDQTTVLYWAIRMSSPAMVAALLQADGINIRELDQYNNSALMVAVARNRTDILELVLDKIAGDADLVNATSVQGTTALHVAALLNLPDMLVYLLQEKSIRFDLQTEYGETAISIAISRGFSTIERMLKRAYKERQASGRR